ncbi:MAG: exosome complex RNA-binding protein Csl4 [Candidatus Hadarchaeota archaeon]
MTEIKTGDFVLPGDFLATAEEFVPGEGAYDEGGKIYAASTGVVLVDSRNKKISVFSRPKGPPALRPGDAIIGRVDDVREQSVSIEIGAMRGREDRELPAPKMGSVHISQANTSYVRDLSYLFKVGDIVRAKVVSTQREQAQLTTASKEFGVLVASCSRCKTTLDRDGTKLRCPNCGNIENRKTASDYRQGAL